MTVERDALATITDALFRHRERNGLPRLWGVEHAEDRAKAVLAALAESGLEIVRQSNPEMGN